MKQFLSTILFLIFFFTQAQPGSVDTTFNSTDLGFGLGDGANDYVKDIMIQPNGKIIIGGDFTIYNTNTAKSLARINTDGSFDSTFIIGSGANDYVSSFIAQPDGKIIVCGSFTTFNGVTKNRIVRLNADGTTDAGFLTGTGADGVIECVALQTDGKIIIGGQFTKFNGITRQYIARLNADGSLDTTFNTSSGFNSHVYSVAVQADGKILAGGNFTTYNSVSKNYVVRINSDASIDDSFATTGFNNIVYKILLSGDGKIFIGGKFTKYNNITKNAIVKINEDATIDETFTIGTGANNIVRNILILNDKKLMLGGDFTIYSGTMRNYITRINENGTIDTSFNPGKGFGASVTSFQQQSDGKLMTGGSYSVFNNNVKHYISRINLDGTLDTTFNPGYAADGTIRNIAVQTDKKIIIVGNFNSFNDSQNNRVARIDADGNVDNTLQVGVGADLTIRAAAVQSDNKIIVGGDFSTFNTIAKSYLVRISSAGSIDNDFKIGYGPTDPVRDILIQPDGKILVCGDFTVFNTKTANRILRLNTDGTIDTSFQPLSGANNAIYAMKLQPDNKILISGNFTTYDGVSRNRLARINVDGTLDTSFAVGTGANNTVSSMVIQADGKIVIGGNFTTFNGVTSTRVARVNTNGSRDASFTATVGANASVETLVMQENGKVLIGGSFTKYNNVTRNYIARLETDGTLDLTFNKTSAGANKPIYKLITQDEKFLAVGDFTSYNSTGRNRITRIIGGEEEHLAGNNYNVEKVKIYPNPTSEKLLISATSQLVRFNIYDFTGRRLSGKEFNKDNYTIDVSHLGKGIYILELTNDKGKIQSQKFIIE
ncbi:T9SS type A sorting domain-containing protein [Epilithonimonas sp. UC225_85]|uniref:T9SS type A sorting domain-containing protein n=1 Tax=Epilithonimonas sp. UC225_85 TaxID=3350167 RepID=UPI0036D3E7D3